ncbi:MAG: type II secretion system F family protein [bacterium]|nr:type II secretion system F family protein [bacterium]
MQKYTYKSKDKNGRDVNGQVEAQSLSDAARLLREQNYIIISLNLVSTSPLATFRAFTNRITFNDVVLFTRQFATMITSGLPITDALVIARSQSKPAMGPVISQILSDVEGGSSLGAAFEKHPKVFSSVYISLVKAGEEGGVLDQIMARLADNLEGAREFQSKVKGALIYPAIVICGMVIVAAIMMIFVVPKLTSLYGEFQADLPLPTKILISVSTFMAKFWWLMLFFLVGAGYWFLYYIRTEGGKRKFDEWKLKVPIYGPLQRQIILTEMTRTLGLLVGAGIAILEAMKIIGGVVGNTLYAEAIQRCSDKVEKGFSLASSFSEEKEVFPQMLYQMLAVGEETGKIDESLLKVSQVFEQESEQQVKALTAAVEPIVMVILGVGVGFLVIAVIMPIYNLTSQF